MNKYKKIGSLIGFTILASSTIVAIPFVSTSCGTKDLGGGIHIFSNYNEAKAYITDEVNKLLVGPDKTKNWNTGYQGDSNTPYPSNDSSMLLWFNEHMSGTTLGLIRLMWRLDSILSAGGQLSSIEIKQENSVLDFSFDARKDNLTFIMSGLWTRSGSPNYEHTSQNFTNGVPDTDQVAGKLSNVSSSSGRSLYLPVQGGSGIFPVELTTYIWPSVVFSEASI